MADSLTDAQLVAELQSLGETVSLPIKANRRQILIKKLNHLRTRRNSTRQKGKGRQPAQRRHLNLDAFSSDDSDSEPAPPPKPINVDSNNRRSFESSASSKITEVVTRSLRHRPNVSSFSVNAGRRKSPMAIGTVPPSAAKPNSSVLSGRRNRDGTPEPDLLPDKPVSNYRSSLLYPELSLHRRSITSRDTSLNDRSTIPFESSDSDIEGSSYEVANKSVNTSIGYNQGRRTPISSHVSPIRYNTHLSSKVNLMPNRSSQMSQIKARRRFYPEHISCGLVTLVLAFFLVIVLGYMFVQKELFRDWFFADPSLHAENNNYLLCPDNNGTKCYMNELVLKARIVINDLYTDLSAKKGKVICGEADESEMWITGSNLLKDLKRKMSSLDNQKLYNCTLDLIIANPSWNLRVLTKDGVDAKNVSQVEKIESAVASMGLLCRIRRSFSRVLWSLFILVTGVMSLSLVLMLLWWHIQAKEREEKKVFAMVEQIIDLLKEQHELVQSEDSSEQSGLAVQHVRDQLLPPAKRKALHHIWDKAVKFIEANESRVRLETQIIEGEEFAVWRWIQAGPNGGKVWQGQAFGEYNENNASTAVYSPTPCLKIRNMFDKDAESEEDWEDSVKDALLEKCQDIKSLVHIFVDKNSKEGCVYVKCNSKEAAGKVRQALHGWWFDGRLVTVKHLKVEHYHNRWPEAKFAWRPLQPSTNQMRSLAQPYHRSTLEMT